MQDTPNMGPHMSATPQPNSVHGDLKRKRSSSHENMQPAAAPVSKAAKTHTTLQINYLVRHYDTDLPLITQDETMANILHTLNDYQGVLDRHESMASNLGARPLGPILLKRFEKMFDGPPRVLTNHNKNDTTVTWLDVFDFARTKPDQFQLGQQSEGASVCQFYTKQCRVQITEEDFLLIKSGIPQQMIPPQPIPEDEEKELATLNILEEKLTSIAMLADQVAGRTRQLNHRLKARSQAIMDRRAAASPAPPMRASSPSNVALMNGTSLQSGPTNIPTIAQSQPQPSTGGFVAVNSRPLHDPNVNGVPSQDIRQELISKFQTLTERRASSQPSTAQSQTIFSDARRPSIGHQAPLHPPTSKPLDAVLAPGVRGPPFSDSEHQHLSSPVPIPNTPSNLLPTASQRSSQQQDKDDGGIYKGEMVRRMESLSKNERIQPPCDRCRRLHMDCLKNLTACVGCTRKHAKCSWREVTKEELIADHHQQADRIPMRGAEDVAKHERASTSSPDATMMRSPHQGVAPLSHPPPAAPHPLQQLEDRSISHNRDPPQPLDRNRDETIEAQLRETARTTLALPHSQLRASDSKPTDHYQTMVA